MKLLIASDIHGSAFYCEKLIKRFEAEKAEKMLILGDILYHGPRNALPDEYAPKSVISMLNNMKDRLLCVRGNCDTEVDQMVLDFPILADYALINIDGITMYATHGHIYNEKNLPPISCGDVLLNGHTHIPKCVRHENYFYMNPGSVSIPKEGSQHGYMVFEKRTFSWKDLDGNLVDSITL